MKGILQDIEKMLKTDEKEEVAVNEEETGNLTNSDKKLSLNQLIKNHRESLNISNYDHLIQKLELIRNILEQIMSVFGDIYEFSEDYFFNVINQALEVVIYNGYSTDKFESMMELFVYQLILTSFREDHQTLFSFYYSLYFHKEIGQHNKLLWSYFIQGPVQNNDNLTWFQSTKTQENWDNFKEGFQDTFKITDANLPGLNIDHNESVNIKIKRERDEKSPRRQATKIITEARMQTSQSFQDFNNSAIFFPTEANIHEPVNKSNKNSLVGLTEKNEDTSNLTILTRRKHRKSNTMNMNINIEQISPKMKGKKYQKKIEICNICEFHVIFEIS